MAFEELELHPNNEGLEEMSQVGEARDADYVLTLEEIGNLAAEGGKPAETLINLVALIARRFRVDVCSAYLLEPDRANLVLAATVGLNPQCVGTLRMGLNEGLTGLVAEQVRPVAVENAQNHPRFKYFREAGEETFKSFLGVPLIDRGVLQGVLVVQTKEPRIFQRRRNPHADGSGRAGGAGGQRSAHARSLHRSRAGTALVAGAQSLVELGSRLQQPVPRSRSGALAAAESQSDFAAERNPAGDASSGGPRELVLHSRINYAYRRQQEYLQADRTWGARHAGVLRPRPVAYFSAEFGLHESIPDLFRRPGRSGRRSHQERFRSRTFRWSASACSTARDISGSGSTATAGSRKSTSRPTSTSCRWSRRSAATASRSRCRSRPAAASIRAKVWRMKVGRCDLLLLDSNVEGNAPEDRELTSRLYGGDGRIRIRQELLLGVGGFRALKAMGITPGVLHLNEGHSGFAVLEAIRSRMEEEGMAFDAGRAARFARSGVHHPHAGAGRPRPFQRRSDRRAPGPAARHARAFARRADGARPRESRTTTTKSSA